MGKMDVECKAEDCRHNIDKECTQGIYLVIGKDCMCEDFDDGE